ncbi:MAG: flippase [Alistipes sp.]
MMSKKTIISAIKSKDGKTLLSNFMWLSALQVVSYVFPILTLPYLARVIGVDSFGEIAFAGSIIAFLMTIVTYGFNLTAVRDIAKSRNDIYCVSKIFSNVITTSFMLMMVSAFILGVCIYTIPFLRERQLLLWITFLSIPGYIMFPEWFFQAMEKMKYVTIMNVSSKLIFTILVFIIIREKNDYIYQPLLGALGYLVGGVISLWLIFKKFRVKYIMPTPSEIWCMIKDGWNLFLSLILPNLYNNFSIVLLRSYYNAGTVGIYTSGYKFIDLFDQVSNVLSRVFYPFLSRRLDKHSLYVRISGFISISASLILFFGADLLIKIFYTTEFAASATIIRVMSICPIFIFLMNAFGTNYLVVIKEETIYRNIILYCSIFGFLISWAFVVLWGAMGMSLTIVLVWGIRGVLTWYFAYKLKKAHK